MAEPMASGAARYFVNEWFYSLQGEGVRSGEPSLFLRFGRCNLACRVEAGSRSPGGFDCDTEFRSGRWLSLDEIVGELRAAGPQAEWVVLTGGEPALQVDAELVERLHSEGWRLAIETNGSIALPAGIDWITVSPKVAEHAIRQLVATEVKYVRAYGQGLPKPKVKAEHYLISPAFGSDGVDERTLKWCLDLVEGNPPWRLTVQLHKFLGVR